MAKRKSKLTAEHKRQRRARKRKYRTIFNGKQKRVLRETTIDGMSVDEYITRNADVIWLHQNEMWEVIYEREMAEAERRFNE